MMEREVKHRFRLDPRTKLYLLMAISILAMVGYRGPILLMKPYFILLPFLLLALNGKTANAVKYLAVYLLAVYWEAWLFFLPSTGFLKDIIRLVMIIIVSFMPCMIAGVYAIQTTRVSEFIAAMQKLHLSLKIIIPFVVLFRFFPTVAEEYKSIRDAMRMRAITLKSGPVAMMEYRLVPLMISLVKIGDDLSAAAATRALSTRGERTNLCQLHLGIWDGIIFLMTTAVLAVLILSLGG